MGVRMSDVRCLWEAAAMLGEGPLWSPGEGALYWVDIKAPALHRYRPADGDKTSWVMPEPIGWVIERSNGLGLVAGFKQRGFAFITPGTMMLETIGRSEEHTSELQSLMRISYAVFCLKKKKQKQQNENEHIL